MENSQDHSPIRLALYPSAHGLGHLTRIVHLAQILQEAHPQRYQLFIRANIDSSILDSLKLGCKQIEAVTFSSYDLPIQPSVIQTNPYTLSAPQTWDAVRNFDAEAALKQEKDFVAANQIDVIISDCPSIPCVLGVPSILVTNFLFDAILGALLQSGNENEDIRTFIEKMTKEYQSANALIRLPGFIPLSYSGRTIEAPLHFRRANTTKNDTLRALKIPALLDPATKILLHCFGGQPNDTSEQVLPQLPPNWICLSATIYAPPHFHRFAKDAHIPDLIAASDAVLGKLGWGMCSEVIGNGYRPFIYVPRSAFVEEQGLIEWMEKDHRRLVRMEVEAFEGMNWVDAVLKAGGLAGPRSGDLTAENWARDEEALVGMVDSEVARLLER